jgi:hypothetical protein
MGNRMLCAASGLIWARAVGRACFVDWRDDAYSREGENSLFHFFDPPHAIRDPRASTINPSSPRFGRVGST